MIQAAIETWKKQVKSPKGLINGWPLNHSHSCVIAVVTPRERAGHLVLLEVGLSADQCNTSVCWGEVKKKNKC